MLPTKKIQFRGLATIITYTQTPTSTTPTLTLSVYVTIKVLNDMNKELWDISYKLLKGLELKRVYFTIDFMVYKRELKDHIFAFL